MKLKHTQKKSANRSIRKEIFKDAMIGIIRKHGQRLSSNVNTHLTKGKKRRREDKHLKNVS